MTLEERFSQRTSKTDSCWLWIGSKDQFGYGKIKHNKRQFYAHRLSWRFHRGPIPLGLCVLHKCDVPACVNPEHLFLGTKSDNAKDRDQKGRQCPPFKLTGDQVRYIRKAIAAGAVRLDLAKKLCVSEGAIRAVERRRTWANYE